MTGVNGFLRSLAALLPAAAVVAMPAAIANPPTAPKTAESGDLLQLAGQLDAAERNLAAAIATSGPVKVVRAAVCALEEVVELIHQSDCSTYLGLAIKARAVVVAIGVEKVDDYVAFRAKTLYAPALARKLHYRTPGSVAAATIGQA